MNFNYGNGKITSSDGKIDVAINDTKMCECTTSLDFSKHDPQYNLYMGAPFLKKANYNFLEAGSLVGSATLYSETFRGTTISAFHVTTASTIDSNSLTNNIDAGFYYPAPDIHNTFSNINFNQNTTVTVGFWIKKGSYTGDVTGYLEVKAYKGSDMSTNKVVDSDPITLTDEWQFINLTITNDTNDNFDNIYAGFITQATAENTNLFDIMLPWMVEGDIIKNPDYIWGNDLLAPSLYNVDTSGGGTDTWYTSDTTYYFGPTLEPDKLLPGLEHDLNSSKNLSMYYDRVLPTVLPEGEYKVSFMAKKGSSDSISGSFSISPYDADNNSVDVPSISFGSTVPNGSYQEYTASFSAPNGIKKLRISILSSSSQYTAIYIRDIKLIRNETISDSTLPTHDDTEVKSWATKGVFISGWFKRNNQVTADDTSMYFDCENGGGFKLGSVAGDSDIKLYFNSNEVLDEITVTDKLNNTNWNHIVFLYNPNSKNAELWINGDQVVDKNYPDGLYFDPDKTYALTIGTGFGPDADNYVETGSTLDGLVHNIYIGSYTSKFNEKFIKALWKYKRRFTNLAIYKK